MMGQGMMEQWFVGLPGPLFKVIFIGLFFLWMYIVCILFFMSDLHIMIAIRDLP